MLTASFSAMDTDVDLAVAEPCDREAAARAFVAVEALFAAYERCLTRFSDLSELSALNRSAGTPFVASPLLYSAVDAAIHAAGASGGVFDPSVLHAVRGAGYDKTFAVVALTEPRRPPIAATPLTGAYRAIRLDPAARTVTLPAGCGLDLGGIGKGLAVDAAGALLGPLGSFFVNAGGDLLARGMAEDGPWLAGVEDPFHPQRNLAVLTLADAAVATSSIVRRRWVRGGVVRHHLIDPRTGTSAETDLAAATIVARTATEADVLAKTAVILGRTAGRAHVEARGAGCLLVGLDGSITASPGLPSRVAARAVGRGR